MEKFTHASTNFSLTYRHWDCQQVQGAVHGVTTEECKAALQSYNWSIPQAVNYLKVHLFITYLSSYFTH